MEEFDIVDFIIFWRDHPEYHDQIRQILGMPSNAAEHQEEQTEESE